MKSRKKEIEKIEEKLDKVSSKEEGRIKIIWCEYGKDDPVHEWINEDGSIEMITSEEFKKRGGVIIEWDDEAC